MVGREEKLWIDSLPSSQNDYMDLMGTVGCVDDSPDLTLVYRVRFLVVPLVFMIVIASGLRLLRLSVLVRVCYRLLP